MKPPKRIADLLSRKQAFIDSQRDKLSGTMVKLQSDLFSDIVSELITELDIKDGLIQETVKNYKLISVLDKTYKEFAAGATQTIVPQVVNATSKIGQLSTDYFSTVMIEGLPARFDNVVTKANKLINLKIGIDGDKIFKGGWLDAFFNSNTLGIELKQLTSQAVTSNMGKKEFITLLKDKITGTPDYQGKLESQFNMYAYDLYQQYDAAYNLMIGNEFGFNYFIYQGGLIDDSRDFCAAHNAKVWSIEEMKTWASWVPADGEYPAGYTVKAKDLTAVPSYLGYPGYDPGLNRGGYHCRHALGWIDSELAYKMRPELREKLI
jgi:hypothetical protein